MTAFRLSPEADADVDDILDYTRDVWGREQASAYVRGLYDMFDEIASRRRPWKRADLGTEDVLFRRHYGAYWIYWRETEGGMCAIVGILHERMDMSARMAVRLRVP
ncbi:MAG: type II toxin-antitoxin system RelE/ParE family toxin [Pacificimonas sp.]